MHLTAGLLLASASIEYIQVFSQLKYTTTVICSWQVVQSLIYASKPGIYFGHNLSCWRIQQKTFYWYNFNVHHIKIRTIRIWKWIYQIHCHLLLCKIILNFSVCYLANQQLKPAYSKNSLKIKNQNNTKINVTSQKFWIHICKTMALLYKYAFWIGFLVRRIMLS